MSTDATDAEVNFGERQRFLCIYSHKFNFDFVENDVNSPVELSVVMTRANSAANTVATNTISAINEVTADARPYTSGVAVSSDSSIIIRGEQ